MITISFHEIYSQVQNFVQDPSQATLEIIKDEINKEYEKLAQSYDWPELRGFLNESINTTLGQAYLALPADCAQIVQISDQTDDFTLGSMELDRIVRDNISLISTNGRVLRFAQLGYKATRAPLSIADGIRVLSEDTSDVSIALRAKGLRSSPEVAQTETISLNGTTPVNGTITFRAGWSIDAISTSGEPQGVITITEQTTTTNTLAHIPIGEKYSTYFVIQFENPPDSSHPLTVIYKKRVKRMINDDDAPIIPVGHALVEAVKSRLREYDKKYAQAQVHSTHAREQITGLLSERGLQSNRIRQAAPDMSRRLRRGY